MYRMTPREKLFELLREKDMPAYPNVAKDAGIDYTNYLLRAHKDLNINFASDGKPYVYTPHRNRQCSIGWHEECSDPEGTECGCICHDLLQLIESHD